MRHQSQSITTAAPTTRTASATSRWLVVAVSLCGALAGASVVEALAALTSHSGDPIAPDHLIAVPLVLAGAICGALLAAVLVGKEQRADNLRTSAATEPHLATDIVSGETIFWQPAPTVVSYLRTSEPAAAMTRPSLQTSKARRVRRAVRRRGYGHTTAQCKPAHPATHH